MHLARAKTSVRQRKKATFAPTLSDWFEKEKYTYYDKDLLLKGLEANNLSPVKIEDGYGEGILKQ